MSKFASLNKNVKILIISVIGLILLGAAATVLLLLPDGKKTEDEPGETTSEKVQEGNLIFTDKSAKEIESVKVTNSAGSYTITATATGSDGEQVFSVKELEAVNAPLLSTDLNSALGDFSRISAKQLVEADAEDLEKYGLKNPAAQAEMKFTDGTEISFAIGLNAPTGSFNYIKRADENDVYIAASYLVEDLLKSKYDYIQTKVLDDYDTETNPVILKMTVTKPDEPVTVIEALPEFNADYPVKFFHTHRFAEPVNVGIESTLGESLVFGLYGLKAEKAVAAGTDEIDYNLTGLNNPTCKVDMQVGGKIYTLTLGQLAVGEFEDGTKKTLGYYGIFSEIPDVLYIFPQSALPWLDIDYEKVMVTMFHMPYIYAVSDVIVETYDVTMNFAIKENEEENGADNKYDFYFNGERIEDEQRFKTFYQFLISARSEGLYNEESVMSMIARYTYKYKDNVLPDDVIEFYKSDDRKIIIYVNGTPMYKSRALYADRLAQNIDAFLNGGDINISW